MPPMDRRTEANIESLENLQHNLREHGQSLGNVPYVLQYNKRDLPDVMSIADMRAASRCRCGAGEFMRLG